MCLETLISTETDQISPLELNPNSFLAENNSFKVFSGPQPPPSHWNVLASFEVR